MCPNVRTSRRNRSTISRCRELLGDEADALSDDEVRDAARHAEAMARILIFLAVQNGRIH